MDSWPCFDCRHFDTFDDHEDLDYRCKLGRTVTHMNCDFREPFTIHYCKE